MPARRLLAVLGVLTVLFGATGCGLFGDAARRRRSTAFLAAWSAGDDRGAAALTDDPAAASELLVAARAALGARPADRRAGAGAHRHRPGRRLGRADAGTSAPAAAGAISARSSSPGPFAADASEHGWVVRWAPTVRAPAAGRRPAAGAAHRAAPPGPGGRPGRGAGAHRHHGGIGAAGPAGHRRPARGGRRAGRGAVPDRPADHPGSPSPTVRPAPRTGRPTPSRSCGTPTTRASSRPSTTCPGSGSPRSERLLAPDAGFARLVLPAVRTEMAAQLDGVAGWSVLAVDPPAARQHPGRGAPRSRARRSRSGWTGPCRPPPRTRSSRCRSRRCWSPWRPSTGDLLAVAQNGAADAAGAPALAGRYPPGSTFKIATAAAAVTEQRLTADSPVACPGTHRDRRPAGAQRGPLRPRHGAAAHRVRPLLQHDVRRARRRARAGRAARGGAAARAGRRLRGARAHHGHRIGAGGHGHRAARRERLRAGPGAGQPAGHGAGGGHRGPRRAGGPAADPRIGPPRCCARPTARTRPRWTSCGR